MHSFKSYTIYQSKLLEKISDVSYLYEGVSPSLKKEILDLISNIEDESELIRVKNVLTRKYVIEKLDVYKKYTPLNNREIKYIENAIISSIADTNSKIELIDLLLDDKQKIDKSLFNKMNHGSIDKLVPQKIRNNDCFKNIYNDIFNFTSQSAAGLGKGELLFLLIGKNAYKPKSTGSGKKGDVVIDGIHVEVKAGGTIHAGNTSVAKGAVTKYNTDIVAYAKTKGYDTTGAEPLYFKLAPGKKKSKYSVGGDWFWMFLKKLKKDNASEALKIMTNYLQKLYNNKSNEISILAKETLQALGDREKISKIFKTYVFNKYKEHEGFDSLICLDFKRNIYAVSTDGDKNFSNKVYVGIPNTSRGKSTYAIPDGAMGIGLK